MVQGPALLALGGHPAFDIGETLGDERRADRFRSQRRQPEFAELIDLLARAAADIDHLGARSIVGMAMTHSPVPRSAW